MNLLNALATRLWSFNTGEDENLIYYLCEDNIPLVSFAWNTSSICLHLCMTYDCSESEYGELVGNISNGRAISIVAEAEQQSLLMVDDLGLRLDICNLWNCSSTMRLQTEEEVAVGAEILGTTMARSTNNTLAFAYVALDLNNISHIYYRPNYNETSVLELDSWLVTDRKSVV